MFALRFTGHPAKETVQLINEENIAFTFSFSESSCHTEGYASSLSVEPMSGTVLPKSRYDLRSHGDSFKIASAGHFTNE